MIVSDVAAIQNHRSDRCDRRSRARVIRIAGQIYAAILLTPRDYAIALVYGQSNFTPEICVDPWPNPKGPYGGTTRVLFHLGGKCRRFPVTR